MAIQMEESWKLILEPEFEKQYMKDLKAFLLREKESGHLVYPPSPAIFNAFNHTPVDQVKVVIIGQDPYHGQGQAHGLSFSVQKGVRIPPSLMNIFKELVADIPGFSYPAHGDLTSWADQGVLLLNATLTVRANAAGSHQNKGWERFTDEAIRRLSDAGTGIVFLLWGRFAQSKETLIDTGRHYILKAPHPSPLAQGFLGCRHFSKANALLRQQGKTEINWQV
jgi:uracil-DNA glycosylase